MTLLFFRRKYVVSSELINISISHSNVLVVTSLSKYPGLAGCLIGFITGTESAIGFLRQVRPMYEIGSLSSNILNIALSSWDKCLDVVDQTNLCKINLETLFHNLILHVYKLMAILVYFIHRLH